MLLTIDVGNTNTVLGVFRGEELIAHWRLTTARLQTVDEYGVLTRNLFTLKDLDPKSVSGIIVSSVVPPVNWTLGEMARIYFAQKALFVEPGVKTGMAVLLAQPIAGGTKRGRKCAGVVPQDRWVARLCATSAAHQVICSVGHRGKSRLVECAQ